ncbi:MAG TPA: hypothetical protein VFL76_04595 [Edaphocola sp.]|nr:hypothetical protein [Edaphocola sp.]
MVFTRIAAHLIRDHVDRFGLMSRFGHPRASSAQQICSVEIKPFDYIPAANNDAVQMAAMFLI